MKTTWISLLVLATITSCKSKESIVLFTDSTATYAVKNKGNDFYIFCDADNPEQVKAFGPIVNGFRNGAWNYYGETQNHVVKWALYEDRELGYSTNLLAEADSTIHGDVFTKFLFSSGQDKIIAGVIINGPVKDSLPEKNYQRISENYYKTVGAKLISYDTMTLHDSTHKIYVNEVVVDDSTGKRMYMKSAFAFMKKNNDLVEIVVTSTRENKTTGYILFDGIVSAFFLKGERLYNPFN